MSEELYTLSGEAEELCLLADKAADGQRLDAFLANAEPRISRTRAQALIEDGLVSIDAEIVTLKKRKVSEGEEIEVTLPLREPLNVAPEPVPIDIVYEDDSLMVVNKPAGLVVHPAPGNETGTLVNGILWHLGLGVNNHDIRPGIVHRIDKNTSGLLVIAKTEKAQSSLAMQLADHSMKRIYTALVRGTFRAPEGMVDAPIGRDRRDRKKFRVMTDGSGKRAVTHWRVIEEIGDVSLLELRLETGRTHQIRVHMAHIQRPVLGDDIYGRGDSSGQYLHAGTLGFVHPESGEYVEFTAPLPERFAAMLANLRAK